MSGTRHRWGVKARFEHKTEQECGRCGIVKVSRNEWQAGRNLYWTEYWRNLERIDTNSRAPRCADTEVAYERR